MFVRIVSLIGYYLSSKLIVPDRPLDLAKPELWQVDVDKIAIIKS